MSWQPKVQVHKMESMENQMAKMELVQEPSADSPSHALKAANHGGPGVRDASVQSNSKLDEFDLLELELYYDEGLERELEPLVKAKSEPALMVQIRRVTAPEPPEQVKHAISRNSRPKKRGGRVKRPTSRGTPTTVAEAGLWSTLQTMAARKWWACQRILQRCYQHQ